MRDMLEWTCAACIVYTLMHACKAQLVPTNGNDLTLFARNRRYHEQPLLE